ncbi:molybdopterin cofactor-binding domain-containing protein [Oceanobacter mangrovi]|uniref:molybdopterin cofactor-binding domain-containing protein n=1 Tax=Oceanobacter mangrovi TaxID=2862510 RepID=UPI001C8EC374|nr:molybdopterin cofactor-binding domain-containing protein [Oceanobacter mangrovi]
MEPILNRAELMAADNVLLLLRPSNPPLSPAQKASADQRPPEQEVFLAIHGDGRIIALNGHVDLGTGIGTALAQIVAEELYVQPKDVQMILGDTDKAPNQGATIASATIQITAVPLRKAAATARQFLLEQAAARWQCQPDQLITRDGRVGNPTTQQSLSYGELVQGQAIHLQVDEHAALKPVDEYQIVGKSAARKDIPAKATGQFEYVHDVRIPGMLHGRVIRPPYAGRDGGEFIGNSLLGIDRDSIAHIPGIITVEVIGDFIGIVAEREEQADRAARELKVDWKPSPDLPDINDLENAIRNNPTDKTRTLVDEGNIEQALQETHKRLTRTYVWPYHMHGSIGPSCAVADIRNDQVLVWSGTQNPHILRADLAFLLNIDENRIEIIRHQAAGCYGRNCADDVCGDAVLLSRAVGHPVRVQLTREQEHLWEPKGAGQLMEVDGGIAADGRPYAYDFTTSYPSNGAPMLALLLTGVVEAIPAALEMGDRTSIPPYQFDHMRIRVEDMAPMVRAAWMRGVSAMPNTFAHESYIDELAAEAGEDPVAYRLKYLQDERAKELLQNTATRANWQPRTGSEAPGSNRTGNIVKGRGVAYARYIHSKFPGFGAAWAAWIADVEVDQDSGEVNVTRVTVGHDAGLMINPDGVKHQVHGNIVQSTSRVLKEEVTFNEIAVADKEWGSYPILTFPELPEVDVLLAEKPEEPPMGAGESASVPSAAAIANAIYDATGVRMRQPPFTPERVRNALEEAGVRPKLQQPTSNSRKPGWKSWLGGLSAATLGTLAMVSPWRAAIPEITQPLTSPYSAATIARGAEVFAAGDCAVCHTAEGGIRNAGGRPLETPFGTVYSTNLTPDPQTGIGKWSFTAFDRAMRQGISRDGKHLYPVFPYTAYQNISDGDMQALYAYIMSQPAVSQNNPKTELGFPFGMRPLMAGWNTLFQSNTRWQTNPTQTAQWNRGAYLVNGLGHCGACHSPRNLMGAEKTGIAFLAGGEVDGWEAPALNGSSRIPLNWTEPDLYDYLRTGYSEQHGPAAGPMAAVVEEMQQLPDADIQAIAHYLANLDEAAASPSTRSTAPQTTAAPVAATTTAALAAVPATANSSTTMTNPLNDASARMFESACAGCHETRPDWFGVNPNLAVNSNVHSDKADNLIRTILFGIQNPATSELGYMPGFANSMNNGQIANLLRYMRSKFASDKPAWQQLEQTIAHIRANPGSH